MVLTLSKRADYGLLALGFIARQEAGRWVSGEEIAQRHRIPREQLAKVLQSLARAEILRSRAGRRGGYRLERSIHAVSMAEVVRAVEGEPGTAHCLADPSYLCGQFEACTLREPLAEVQGRLLDVLNGVAVGKLVALQAA